MRTIAKTAVTLILAGAVMAPLTVHGDSLIRARTANTSDFYKFLPGLPADLPWLTVNSRKQTAEVTLPEAGSVSALMLVPRPAEGWAALTTQPVALRPAPACKQCRQH